jgi:hypothetical protein
MVEPLWYPPAPPRPHDDDDVFGDWDEAFYRATGKAVPGSRLAWRLRCEVTELGKYMADGGAAILKAMIPEE